MSDHLSDGADLERETPDVHRSARRIIAVGGGKGGAGKSLLAANVAIYLATLAKRVVLLDADLGGANLHTFVGVERPRVTLGDLFEKRVARVEDVVVETAISGLGLVSGEGDPSWIANPRPAQKFRLLNQVQQLDVDYLVVDLGPGSGFNALDFFLLADVGVLVVVPEPTSVENTYRFLKSAFVRRLKKQAGERALALAAAHAEAEKRPYEGGIPAPLDLYEAAKTRDPELARLLAEEMRTFRPRIVVNQVRARSDLDLGPGLASAARRRLGLQVEYLGHLEHDDSVWLAVRKRRPLMVEHPDSAVANGIERVARRLMALETSESSGPLALTRPIGEYTHYDMLEIDPAASDEEIRRAHRRVRELFGTDSLVVSGLFDRDRLAALHLRFEEAYDTLMDPERRKSYDLRLFPDGLPTRMRPNVTGSPPAGTPVVVPPGSSGPVHVGEGRAESRGDVALVPARDAGVERPAPPPEPELGPSTVYTGPLLRQIREARSIDLVSIATRSKVGIAHLRAIEAERWEVLPATVYVRGFLREYARYLRLDEARVISTYVERYLAARSEEDRD